MKKLLITGGAGLLGRGIAACQLPNYEVHSIRLGKTREKAPWKTQSSLDITSNDSVEKIFTQYSFDVVIHAAGIASVDYVKNNYAESLESIIGGTLNISSACRKRDVPLVYISSNAVFDGCNALYSETDHPNPINEYGELKLECERLIQKTLDKYLIVRPILMYGWNGTHGRLNPVTWLLKQLGERQKVFMVDDVRENPLYNLEAGRCIWKAIEMNLQGILHLAGSTEVNRFELAQLTARIFGLDASLIEPVPSSHFPNLAGRPPNTSFDTRKMETVLGVKPLSLEDGLVAMTNAHPEN